MAKLLELLAGRARTGALAASLRLTVHVSVLRFRPFPRAAANGDRVTGLFVGVQNTALRRASGHISKTNVRYRLRVNVLIAPCL